MKFKEWLQFQEVGTTTGDVAAFRRISIPMSRRMWPPSVATMFDQSPPGEKKNKIKMQPQLEEGRMRNALGAAALLGSAALSGGCSGPNCPVEQPQSQVQGQEKPNWSSGVRFGKDGSIGNVAIDLGPREAKMKALDGLAQYLGTNKLPPGIDVNVEKQSDGSFRATATYSKEGTAMAQNTANQMNNADLLSGSRDSKPFAFKNGRVMNPNDL